MRTPGEQALSLKYAFLTSNVCSVLEHIQDARGPLSDEQKESLDRARGFIFEMRRGTAFILREDSDLGFSPETFTFATRAFTTLSALRMATNEKEVQPFLEGLEKEIRDLIDSPKSGIEEPANSSRFQSLYKFFDYLSEKLTEEAIAGSFEDDIEYAQTIAESELAHSPA